jgi:hypothetical protein
MVIQTFKDWQIICSACYLKNSARISEQIPENNSVMPCHLEDVLMAFRRNMLPLS